MDQNGFRDSGLSLWCGQSDSVSTQGSGSSVVSSAGGGKASLTAINWGWTIGGAVPLQQLRGTIP